MAEEFPQDWTNALIIVAHPDDPEYGMGPAVSRWTRQGKRVTYVLVTSGEAGIEGMPPEEAGPLREEEQRKAAVEVGVDNLIFLGLPDGTLADRTDLAEVVAEAVRRHPADLVVTTYGGEQWTDDIANHPDHIALSKAVAEVISTHRAWHFENGPEPTHHEEVTQEDVQNATRSLTQHQRYLATLEPDVPVPTQARQVVTRSIVRDDRTIHVPFRLLSAPQPNSMIGDNRIAEM